MDIEEMMNQMLVEEIRKEMDDVEEEMRILFGDDSYQFPQGTIDYSERKAGLS